MALNQAQILFKKFVGGVSSTNNDSPYFNELAGASKGNVTLDRLWMLSQRIPTTNPFSTSAVDGDKYGVGNIDENIDILEKVTVRLSRIQGTGGNTAAYAETAGDAIDGAPISIPNRRFKNIINPFSYGSSYSFEVLDDTGNAINLFSPANDGFIDFDSGVVSFYGSDIYNGSYIDVTAYSYIGPLGNEDGLNMYSTLLGGDSSGSTGGGLTQITSKFTNVSVLPTSGNAYNGLFYLVNNGNDGVNGDPIRLNVTFDNGNNWYNWFLDNNNNQNKFIAVAIGGSTNNNQIFTYNHSTVSFDISNPVRNQLVFVESNQVTLIDNLEQPVYDYTYIDNTYYQYTDNDLWEPKSFEKSSNVELEQDATETTITDGHPTGFTLPIRSENSLDFIEISQMYNLETLTQAKLNRNNFKLYLNGQKIDIFDDVEQDPVFNGNNPIDDYDDFFGAFGDFTPSFNVSEGSEGDPNTVNTVTVDLTAGISTIEEWFGVNVDSKIQSDYNIRLNAFDLNFIDINSQFYNEELSPSNNGDSYPFFFIELSDGVDTYYRKITSYQETASSDSYEFVYDGSNLTGTGIISMRLIYFKRPSRITGGESFFWLPSVASYQITPGDELVLNYLGDIEKSILVKNNLNNLTIL